MTRAPLAARFLAFAIDAALLWCVAALITGSTLVGYSLGAGRVPFKDPLALVFTILLIFISSGFLLFLLYFTFLTSGEGRTIGKGIFGMRVVSAKDGGKVGWGRAFARTCAYALSAFPFFLGFFMAFLLGGRALHDILTGTMVAREE